MLVLDSFQVGLFIRTIGNRPTILGMAHTQHQENLDAMVSVAQTKKLIIYMKPVHELFNIN